MGAHEGSRRRPPMEAEGRIRGGYCAGCPRSVEEARPNDVHDGPGAEAGPDLREDLKAFPRESPGTRGRIRQGMVQADAPRHGTPIPVPWPARSQGDTAVAGPGSRGG